MLSAFILSGCSTLDDFFGSAPGARAGTVVPLKERPVEEPIPANTFILETPDQSVVGMPQVVYANASDTLSDLARTYGLGYDELVAANPGVNPWLPGDGTPVLLPTQYVIPDVPRQGIVLNIASKRLFYFPAMPAGEPQIVKTYPIGIGRVGWETPLGETTVISKARDPAWYPPLSVRQEHAANGDPLPAVVPPGPDNPLGNRVLKLDLPGYLIHGTNQPYGVGMRVSHGCVRLYPENIELLYELVAVGETVTIIDEPFLIGALNGEWYFEAHAPLEEDAKSPEEHLAAVFAAQAQRGHRPLPRSDMDNIRSIASVADGVPVRISRHDADEVLERARLVRNTVQKDPDAPTLSEVRELIDQAVREGREQDAAEAL